MNKTDKITKMDVYEYIMIELGNFNFKRNSMSFQYLIEAIYMVVKNKNVIKDFNHCVYPKIAEKYETKPENVLWNISKLIKMMYLNTDSQTVKDYFKIQYDENPSVKAFIIFISYNVVKKISQQKA